MAQMRYTYSRNNSDMTGRERSQYTGYVLKVNDMTVDVKEQQQKLLCSSTSRGMTIKSLRIQAKR
jgi:hypothetical protein